MGEKINQVFQQFWNTLIEMLPNFIVALLFFALFSFMGYLIGKAFAKGVQNRWKNAIVVGYIGKVLRWGFNLIGLIIGLHVLGFGGVANTLLTGAGISAIIIGFAFKDIAENFLAGLLLLMSRPFEIGHIIEVNGFRGTARGLDLRTTHLRSITGKDIYLPNALMIKNVVTNYTRDGFLRLDFIIGLDIPTDIEKVRPLIIDFLKQQPEILKKPEPDVLVRDVGEFTIDIQVLLWVDVLKQKKIPPAYLGETIRSRLIAQVKELLLLHEYVLPSQIIEHKMYQEESPIQVEWKAEKGELP